MRTLTTLWTSRLILAERSMLRFYGVPEDRVMKADGSFMMKAFLNGWRSALRRTR